MDNVENYSTLVQTIVSILIYDFKRDHERHLLGVYMLVSCALPVLYAFKFVICKIVKFC